MAYTALRRNFSIVLIISLIVVSRIHGSSMSSTSFRKTTDEQRLVRYLSRHMVSSRTQCALTCVQTEECISFSYHRNGTCELSSDSPTGQLTTQTSEPGWSIYTSKTDECWPEGYDGFIHNEKCYFWPDNGTTKTWRSSQEDCRVNGAELVCIESGEENEVLGSAVPMLTWWFGLNDLKHDRDFTCNGEELEKTSWAPSNPGHEHCIIVDQSDNMWYDRGCSLSTAYVCEKNL